MAKYTVHYEVKQNSTTSSGSKIVDSDSESAAIEIVKGQTERPGGVFKVKSIKRH
jgi:hypothetical protein